MVESILVPMDGSELSVAGLEHALEEHPGADVHVLYVMTPFEQWDDADSLPTEATLEAWYERSRGRSADVFETAERLGDERGVEVETVLAVGEPWREIVSFADANAVDLVVMGSHGRTDDQSLPLGSVAETVMRRSDTLVSIVR